MSQTVEINENALYHKCRDIWQKHFSNIIPFNQYYFQVRNQVRIYSRLSTCDKIMFMEAQTNIMRATLDHIENLSNLNNGVY